MGWTDRWWGQIRTWHDLTVNAKMLAPNRIAKPLAGFLPQFTLRSRSVPVATPEQRAYIYISWGFPAHHPGPLLLITQCHNYLEETSISYHRILIIWWTYFNVFFLSQLWCQCRRFVGASLLMIKAPRFPRSPAVSAVPDRSQRKSCQDPVLSPPCHMCHFTAQPLPSKADSEIREELFFFKSI